MATHVDGGWCTGAFSRTPCSDTTEHNRNRNGKGKVILFLWSHSTSLRNVLYIAYGATEENM